MNADPAAPELSAPNPAATNAALSATDLAGRFGLIIAGLASLIARAFLRNPRLALMIIPLHKQLTRSARRFAALMALLAAGTPSPPARRSGKSGPRHPGPRLPTTPGWLVAILHHEAAAYRSQLAHLLAEPGVSELLSASPAGRRLLRPVSRMLGLPDTALRAVARQAAGVFAFKNPESGAAPCLLGFFW